MKNLFFIFVGMVLGIYSSWPGIFIPNNWRCFKDIIDKSSKEKISFKAALSISPNYILKANRNKNTAKIRIVFDACFR